MLALQLEPLPAVPQVRYTWDADTEILSAAITLGTAGQVGAEVAAGAAATAGAAGSIEVQGEDGSWISLDLAGGALCGAQIAVWPPLQHRATLRPPEAAPARAAVRLGARDARGAGRDGPLTFELSTRLAAEADEAAGHVHFRLGRGAVARSARIADRVIVELDALDRLVGLWLLDVPPLPLLSTDS